MQDDYVADVKYLPSLFSEQIMQANGLKVDIPFDVVLVLASFADPQKHVYSHVLTYDFFLEYTVDRKVSCMH